MKAKMETIPTFSAFLAPLQFIGLAASHSSSHPTWLDSPGANITGVLQCGFVVKDGRGSGLLVLALPNSTSSVMLGTTLNGQYMEFVISKMA
jgi:hypothetical protein